MDKEPQDYDQENYNKEFGIANNKSPKQAEALKYALDIRKFEIDLYWKRATYFWTFIAAALAGFGAIQASSIVDKTDLSVFLSCLGVVFSFGWYCVNRGSKQWQENWENHVDLLEDDIVGPLYKVNLKRYPPKNIREWILETLTGPHPFSVSKINQLISINVTFLWIFLLYRSLPKFSISASINWEYVFVIFISAVTCIFFVLFGKTYGKSYSHIAKKRESSINNKAA